MVAGDPYVVINAFPTPNGWEIMVTDNVDLNKMFNNSQVIHCPNSFRLPSRDQVMKGIIFTENILNQNLKIRANRNFVEAKVTHYFEQTKTHRIEIINTNETHELDLHTLLSKGELEIAISPHVLAHLRAHLQSRPQGREADARQLQAGNPCAQDQDDRSGRYG